MGNTFNISVAPEIAALDAKIDIIDTEVDAIRAVDIPATDVLITTVDTEVDAIRAADFPATDALITTVDTEVGIIDGIVDAIKLKTDLLPQNFRGTFGFANWDIATNELHTLVDLTGSGKLWYLTIMIAQNAAEVTIQLTVDGVAFNPMVRVAVGANEFSYFFPTLSTDADPSLRSNLYDSILMNLEFSTSLLITTQRTAGAGAHFDNCGYSLD